MNGKLYYFEVKFGDYDGATTICIKSVAEHPTVRQVSKFCRDDENTLGQKVTSVYPIERAEAEELYDFSNEGKWPVLGEDN